MDITRYGHWDGPNRFVFTPPLVRQGMVIDDVDFDDPDTPHELSRQELIEAYLRDRIEVYPKEIDAEMFVAATQLGGDVAGVYTGVHHLPGGHVIRCKVCGRTAQLAGPKPAEELSICSRSCLDTFKADPLKYLADAAGDEPDEPAEVHFDYKVAMGYLVDPLQLSDEDGRIYAVAMAEAAEEGHPMVYYPGSVVVPCSDCGLDIFIGPRTQSALKGDPTIRALCPMCVAQLQARIFVQGGVETTTIDLGNRSGIPRTY